MARCPECNKFTSYDDPQVEVTDENFDPVTNVASGSVHVTLPCSECGTDLKEAELDWEIDFSGKHECKGKETEEASIEVEAEGSYRVNYTGRKGKPCKAPQNHYYGAEVTVVLTCGKCGDTVEEKYTAEDEASGFEDLT